MARYIPIMTPGQIEAISKEWKRRKQAKEDTELLQAKVMAERHQAQFGSSSHYEKWKAEQLKKKK